MQTARISETTSRESGVVASHFMPGLSFCSDKQTELHGVRKLTYCVMQGKCNVM